MSKIRVCDLPDQFLTDLKTSGISYERMMDEYGLTRWGARKLGGRDEVSEETAGNHEKIFVLDDETDDFLSLKVPTQNEEVNHEEEMRQTSSSKQTVTNKTNKYLTELERTVKNVDTPETGFEEASFDSSGFTALIHETDPHFSAEVTDRSGEVVFDTDKAEEATFDAFDWYIEEIRDKGVERLDEVVLMLGGDLVEGEDIFPGQAHELDKPLEDQIEAARKCYFECLLRLRKAFEDVPIKVVCVSGNHGDMGTGSGANADDIIYSSLEHLVGISDLENVKFVKSDRSTFTTFTFRNWNGYLTHGENRSHHIGTSSPKSDWLAIKEEFGFDLAFRGHYHNQKVESVNGAPVVMTNSRKPADDYTDKIATFGTTGNALYFATDDEVLEEIRIQTQV